MASGVAPAAAAAVAVEGGVPLLQVEVVDAAAAARDAVVVGVPSDGDPAAFVDGVVDGLERDAARAFLAGLGAKASDVGVVRDLPRPGATPARLLFVGTGAPAADGTRTDSDLVAFRKAGAALARAAKDVPTLTLWAGHAGPELTAIVEGLVLGAYRYPAGSHATAPELQRVEVVGDDATDAVDAAVRAAGAACWARDLTNTRASTKTPQWVADRAVELLTPLGVEVTVRDEEWLAENQFGGVLAVGGGSNRAPRLVEAHWRPKAGSPETSSPETSSPETSRPETGSPETGSPEGSEQPPVLVVGKGIVYDTGGYNIKPGSSMGTMYTDMAGGAAALAALAVVAAQQLPIAVSVLVPLADNAVSATAYRPGDVVVHHGGRTSEITNTDAEGRLVLADALAYGVATLGPRLVVDIATLTGAMRAALGDKIAGVIGDEQPLVDALVAAGASAGERLWQLPLAADEYASEIDSPVADAVNSAGGPPGAITAALFLRPFAGGVPWAHLDIAGTARSGADSGPLVKGATGFGARLLATWLAGLA